MGYETLIYFRYLQFQKLPPDQSHYNKMHCSLVRRPAIHIASWLTHSFLTAKQLNVLTLTDFYFWHLWHWRVNFLPPVQRVSLDLEPEEGSVLLSRLHCPAARPQLQVSAGQWANEWVSESVIESLSHWVIESLSHWVIESLSQSVSQSVR